MNHITVELGAKSYPIMLGTMPEYMPELIKKITGRSVLIVTDENVDAAEGLDCADDKLLNKKSSDGFMQTSDNGKEFNPFA